MKKLLLTLSTVAVTAVPASAGFHLWQIKEVYRSADGAVQFVELIGTADFQAQLTGQTIRLEQTTPPATLGTFTFNAPAPSSSTLGKHLLIGTANLATLYGVTPDYVYNTATFDIVGGANRQLRFTPLPDIETIVDLPSNGVGSINGLVAVGNAARINPQASPTNFAGVTALVPEPGAASLIILGGVLSGLIFARRRSS